MVDLPPSMKTGGFDPLKTAADLEAVRNRSRKDQSAGQSDEPDSPRFTSAFDYKSGRMVPIDGRTGQLQSQPQPQPWSYQNDPLTRAENIANSLDQQRAQARNAQRPLTPAQQTKAQKKEAKQKAEQDKLNTLSMDKDYPNPITLRGFQAFGFFAACQDGLPLLCDLIGIGWIVEYCLLPVTWIAYWYFIIRRSPKSMRRKFWQRTLLLTCVGWIPVVGQFIPEWTATALGAYIVIAMYQRRKSYQAAGEKTNASRGGAAEPAKAAA